MGHGYCHVPRVIAVGKVLLPWAKGMAVRKGLPVYMYTGIVVDRGLLPWAEGYCRTGKQRAFTVSKGLLPWTKT